MDSAWLRPRSRRAVGEVPQGVADAAAPRGPYPTHTPHEHLLVELWRFDELERLALLQNERLEGAARIDEEPRGRAREVARHDHLDGLEVDVGSAGDAVLGGHDLVGNVLERWRHKEDGRLHANGISVLVHD